MAKKNIGQGKSYGENRTTRSAQQASSKKGKKRRLPTAPARALAKKRPAKNYKPPYKMPSQQTNVVKNKRPKQKPKR